MNSLHKEQLLLHCFKLTNIPWQQTAKLKYDINTFWGPGTKIFSEQFPQVPMWTVLQWWNTQSLWKCTWRVLVLHFYHSHCVKTLILPWFKSEMKWEISYRTGLPSSEYSICWASDSDERRLVNSQCRIVGITIGSFWLDITESMLSLHDMTTWQINSITSNPTIPIFITIHY